MLSAGRRTGCARPSRRGRPMEVHVGEAGGGASVLQGLAILLLSGSLVGGLLHGNGFIAILAQGERSMDAAVVELDTLTDAVVDRHPAP